MLVSLAVTIHQAGGFHEENIHLEPQLRRDASMKIS